MNNYKFYFSVVVIFNYLIQYVIANNNYYMIGIKRKPKDINYDDASEEIQNEINELVNKRMNNIYNVIDNLRDIYIPKNKNVKKTKIDKKLEELNKFSQLKKRNLEGNKKINIDFINKNAILLKKNRNRKAKDFSINNKSKENSKENVEHIQLDSSLVNHLFPLSDKYLIQAYLSDEAAAEVKKLPNVEYFQKVVETKESYVISNNVSYNKNDILKETQWKGLEVQKNNFDFDLKFSHLSLLSQGKFKETNNATYDNNYYYPSSAGKGVDIYIIERGVNFSFSKEDFDTYEMNVQ